LHSSFASMRKINARATSKQGKKAHGRSVDRRQRVVPTLDKHLAPANKLADACDHGVAIVSVDHNSVVQITSASLRGPGLIVDEHVRMARNRYGPEEIVAKLRQVEALRSRGQTEAEAEAVRSIGPAVAIRTKVESGRPRRKNALMV
jgi:hypothetical protein